MQYIASFLLYFPLWLEAIMNKVDEFGLSWKLEI